jgi:hypothetical protein
MTHHQKLEWVFYFARTIMWLIVALVPVVAAFLSGMDHEKSKDEEWLFSPVTLAILQVVVIYIITSASGGNV